MSTDEYVPSEDDVRIEYVLAHQGLEAQLNAGEAYDRWLAAHDARVRRDAAREFVDRTLLDWGIGEDEDSDLGSATADNLRAAVDVAYPEESP